MHTVGIVCEYNPFHNGHLDHMRRAAAIHDDGYVVCVQSSDFLQRGEPAILPKEFRAKTAVKNGADLVFELPSVFSCSSAEYYGNSSLLMMDRLGIVDTLVFGSEDNDIGLLKRIAGVLADEPAEFSAYLKNQLGEGLSFAAARSAALSDYLADEGISKVVEGSNNILGIEYIKAIIRNGMPIEPVSVPRIAEEYKNDYVQGRFPSATAIRAKMRSDGLESVQGFLPGPTYHTLSDFYRDSTDFMGMEKLRDAVYYRISSLTHEELRAFPGMGEGFENRLKAAVSGNLPIADFIDNCSSRRYPRTRIARTLIYILLGLTEIHARSIWKKGPLFARLLASSERGLDLMPVIEKNASIPVFTSLKPFYDSALPSWKDIMDLEVKASDIYSVAAGLSTGRDYTMRFNVY